MNNGSFCNPLVKSVGVDKPGGGAEEGHQVTRCNGCQDCVGRGKHLGSEMKRIYICVYLLCSSCKAPTQLSVKKRVAP